MFVYLFASLFFSGHSEPLQSTHYDGYKVVSMDKSSLSHPIQLQYIQSLHDEDRLDVDFWDATDVSLSPTIQDKVFQKLSELNISYTVLYEDLQTVLETHMDSFNSTYTTTATADYFSAYHTWEDIQKFVSDLVQQYNGGNGGNLHAKIEEFETKTYEGNTLQRVLVTGKGGYTATKKIIYLEGCIHAREWIATTSVQFVLDRLLTLYGEDETVTKMMDKFVWVIVPVVNIDGYKFTWTDDRMWRKTRSPNGGLCTGTDPNRNWDYHWCESGASRNPCSDSFCGSHAFSELCVQAVSNWVYENRDRMLIFGDIHTYGSMFFGPWGWTCDEYPKDYDAQKAVFQPAVNALEEASGEKWLGYGTICQTIYAASGSSADWGYGAADITYSFGAEMQGNSFSPPASSILPYAKAWWAGMKVMGQTALNVL